MKQGSEASTGVDSPRRRTPLLMKRGGGSVPFHLDHPEGDLGFDRDGRRGSLIAVLDAAHVPRNRCVRLTDVK